MTDKTRRPKRPSDVIANAIKVARIATGEEAETYEEKSEAKAAAGKKGGKARAAAMSSTTRTEIARAAARKRWS